jgi:hypothetical protein
VRVQTRRSVPLIIEPVVRSDAEKAVSQANVEAKRVKSPRDQRRTGRPNGSTNHKKVAVTCSPAPGRIKAKLDALRQLLVRIVPLTHLGLDGHCGHHNALALARPCHVPLTSKRRCDAALSFPDAGPYAGRGPPRQYDGTVDDDHIPLPYRQETTVQGHIQTRFPQAPRLHQAFAPTLHVVIMVTW